MTQSDSIPTAPIGQVGNDGPDKSMATTLPYTQMGTPSSLDSFLATLVADARAELGLPPLPPPTPSLDSILAATVARARAELAADDREIERGNALGIDFDFVQRIDLAAHQATGLDRLLGQHPACLDHGIPGCAECATLAIRNELGMCAEHLRRNCRACANVDAEQAIERAYQTGLIGAVEQESGGFLRLGKPLTNVTYRFRPKPDKPTALKCRKPQWGKGDDPYGWDFKMWHPCNKCEHCNANAANLKGWRWDVGRGPFQTSIMVEGAANADEARKWTRQLAKVVNIPNRASMVTPDGAIWIVDADPMDADTIQRIRDFAAAEHGNCQRPAMQCTIKTENVKGS